MKWRNTKAFKCRIKVAAEEVCPREKVEQREEGNAIKASDVSGEDEAEERKE